MKNKTVQIGVERFMGELEIRNFSELTRTQYKINLGYLTDFLREKRVEGLKAVTSEMMSEFRQWVFYLPVRRPASLGAGPMRSVANQNRIMIQARAFFRFLKREGVLRKDPTEGLELAREPQGLPKNILTPEEAKRIIETVDISTARGYRDRTILEVFYATGIRNRELINLKVGDVNLEEELLRVNKGKGGKDRLVPLSGVACRFLQTYLRGIRPDLMREPNDRLFLSYRGKPLTPTNLGQLVGRYARLAGVNKHMTCHVWRHSCATHLLKNQANLRHVQEILGHRSLATTERYLRLTITDLKAAHQKFHPREQDCRHE
ncbi:MAG: tyrosine-type recombinase/integrase [Verrucomicrobiae bacterium]|nr:tyrosine-type recombinase/integrase [Verrucomicrobiae bacterium]